jgi:hypothetical protein
MKGAGNIDDMTSLPDFIKNLKKCFKKLMGAYTDRKVIS